MIIVITSFCIVRQSAGESGFISSDVFFTKMLLCSPAQSPPADPGPVYAEVGPAVQFQLEANAAYGPVRKKAAAEQFEMEGNAAYGPVRR